MMAQQITSRDIEITTCPSDMFLSSDVVETTGSQPKKKFLEEPNGNAYFIRFSCLKDNTVRKCLD